MPAAKSAPKSAGKKRKSKQQPAVTATAAPDASGSAPAAPPPKPSFADVVAGRATPEQTISVLVSKIQELTVEVGKVRAFSEKVDDQLQEEKQSYTGRLEHLHRHSKRNNLVVFGVAESMALNTQRWRTMCKGCSFIQAHFRADTSQISLPPGQVEAGSDQAPCYIGGAGFCGCRAYGLPVLESA